MDSRSTLKLSHNAGLALAAAMAALGISVAGPAQAISQDFAFELTTVDIDLLGTGLQPGDVLQGNFSHSSCLSQGCRDQYTISSTFGYYYDLSIGLDLLLGSFQVESNAYVTDIYITNGTAYDSYSFTTWYDVGNGTINPLPSTILGEPVLDVFLLQTSAHLTLVDPDHNALVSGYIPAELPSLAIFEEMSFDVHVYLDYYTASGAVYGREVFSATALLPQVLPEPSTALLLGIGLAGAAATRRRST